MFTLLVEEVRLNCMKMAVIVTTLQFAKRLPLLKSQQLLEGTFWREVGRESPPSVGNIEWLCW